MPLRFYHFTSYDNGDSFGIMMQYASSQTIGHGLWDIYGEDLLAGPMMPMAAWLMWTGAESIRQRGFIKFRLQVTVLIVVGLLSLFSARLIEVGKKVISSNSKRRDWVKLEQPEQLAGIILPLEMARQYRHFNDVMNNYLFDHPHSEVISVSQENLFMTFSQNTRNFHPLTVDWSNHVPFMLNLYPQYNQILSNYLNRNKPLIIARLSLELPPGYKVLETFPSFYWGESIRLLVPIDLSSESGKYPHQVKVESNL